jgi:hypothetical protein
LVPCLAGDLGDSVAHRTGADDSNQFDFHRPPLSFDP